MINQQKLKAKQAIIVARVSSREQEEGYSIDAQLDRLQQYCKRKELDPIAEFVIVESSTNGDRKKFMEMIAFAKKQRQTVAVVADKVDRIQRSFKETPLLDDLVNKGKIELHFHVENCIIHQNSTSMERLMWNMGVLMAQNYVDSLKDNVNRGKNQKLKSGEWVGLAPLGYINKQDDKGRPYIYVDEERAPIITRLFETYASGSHTIGEMVDFGEKWGLRNKVGLNKPINKSQMYNILTNPFYCGTMRLKKDGAEYPHKYPTLVDKALFDRCEEVRLNWGKKPFKYGKLDFVFRGIMKCAITGKTISPERHRKKRQDGSYNEWIYLSAANPDNPKKRVWIREEKVLEQVEASLAKLKVDSPKLLKAVISLIAQTNENKKAFHRRQTATLKKEHTEVEDKLDKLLDLMMESVITREEFEAKKRKLKDRQYEIDELITSHDEADDVFTKNLINTMNLAHGALEKFRSSSNEQKRELLNLIYSNLSLRGKKLEYTMRSPFKEFAECSNIDEWSER